MIKQIQLRGISRTPSDRATADGGCAESLNMQLEENELAPAPRPRNISEDVYGDNISDVSTRYPVRYIHKLPSGAEIYVGCKGISEDMWELKAYKDQVLLPMATVSGEPKEFISVGNTLIVFTSDKPHYFLFKDGAYTSLGSEIPQPAVEVATWTEAYDYYDNIEVPDGALRSSDSGSSVWNAAKNEGDENHADLLGTIKNVWDEVTLRLDGLRNDGKFVAPFFLRYALRLYDGSYIYSSVPILCGGKGRTTETSNGALDWLIAFRYVDGNKNKFGIEFNNIFTVKLLGDYNVGGWGDIVKSIDFFASTPIYAPNFHSAFYEMSSTTILHTRVNGYDITFDGMTDGERDKTVLNEVLSKANFYKVKSVNLSSTTDIASLASGQMRIENSKKVSGDDLLVQEEMPYGYRDGSQYIPVNGTMNFNNRLLLMGGKELLARGEPFLNGQAMTGGTAESEYRFKYRFRIDDAASGETNYVMGKYYNNTDMFLAGWFNSFNFNLYHGSTSMQDGQMTQPYAWLCFPDTRCSAVEISYYNRIGNYINTRVIPLEKHPALECVYAFIGFGNAWGGTSDADDYPQYDTVSFSDAENRYMSQPNKIFLSNFENPFLFSASGILTMPDEVVGAAVTSVPLSEGQFGQFPLYVFTKGGIRVLSVNSEGSFSTNNVNPNLSRHVAYPGTILGIEQAVIFTTDKGVMMLTGGDVQCLSDSMNGRHRPLDADVIEKLRTWDGYNSAVRDTVTDQTTFMGFMKEASVAYDYNGARLVFGVQGKPYHYVYMLRTGTWHKMSCPLTSFIVLNSYPECLLANTSSLSAQGTIPPMIYDYSTVLDDADLLSDTSSPRYSIVASRPFDLGEPDVRKAIRSIRIRGAYNRGDVSYLLLGSFDGINWKLLPSLRGGSYRMFRIVIVSKLSPTERISWVDIDYESRFATRLR